MAYAVWRWTRKWPAVGGVVLGMLLSSAASPAPAKWALLVGVDEYQSPDVPPLKGAVNDVRLMRQVLVGKFDFPPANVLVLENRQATRQAILDAIRDHLIAKARTGDVAVFHFSGHGSQMKDAAGDEGDEIDGLDETLVPHDSRTPGIFDISDDELNGLLGELARKTKNVTFIFDSCHSGAAARGGNTVRSIPVDTRPPPPASSFAVGRRGAEGESDLRLDAADYVLISGSLAKELSNEATFGERRHGALTWFLVQALNGLSSKATYRDVLDDVRAEVSARFPSQHPQIEGPGQDLVVFGTEKIAPRPYVLVSPAGGRNLRVEAGKAMGVGVGTTLKVHAPRTADFGATKPAARVKVTSVDDFEAVAQIVEGGPVQPRSRAVLEAATFGDTSIPVHVATQGSPVLAQVKDALGRVPAIALADDATGARLVVRQDQARILIQSGDLELLVPPVPAASANAHERVVDQVKDIVHWMVVLDLRNPASAMNVGFELRRAGEPRGALAPKELSSGGELVFRIENQDTRPLYVYVLDVSSDGSIELVFPPRGEQQQLRAGGSIERRLRMTVPSGWPSVLDVIKVLATIQPIDASVFPRGPIRSAPEARSADIGRDPLARLLADAMRGKRAATDVTVAADSWVTVQKAVRIRNPTARLASFSLHFDGERDARTVQSRLSSTRTLCPSPADRTGDCARVAPAARDGTVFDLVPEQASRGPAVTVSVGRAFDEAYELQDQTGARRVEPMLEVQVPGAETEQGIDKRDISGDDQHDPAALADDRWNLRQIRVDDAWSRIRGRRDVPEGAEAEGIVIAHPDTGYREHPEIWQEVGGKRPVDSANGRNYLEGGTNAFDPLLDDRLLDNPGHGTASGSVIVSPAGCQLAGAAKCVNGVGRGARLVPLRVHRTVSQFDTRNLSQAIQDVAEGNIAGSPKLVSIAMGGPPSLTMWKAVTAAERNGVLVVAAAGNYVQTVVWPARFKSTIAVAAHNVRCTPWKHSSHGTAIDISAPGESVWRATLNERHEHINGMGKGTTFATGNTSGAAALWLAWHRDDPVLAELAQRGLVTKTFREALRASSWRPAADPGTNPPGTHCVGSSWDPEYGPGMLNAAKLLEVPLSAPRALGPEAREELLPLFASLFVEGTDPQLIRSAYLSLFSGARTTDVSQVEKFETEVLYHYTVNEDVRRAIDSLVSGRRSLPPAEEARRTLSRQDLSGRLREALGR